MSSFLSLACVNIEGPKHLDRVLAFLQKEKPDVVCLQEVYERDLQGLAEKLDMQSAFAPMVLWGYPIPSEPPFIPYGIALLSRFPMEEMRRLYYRGDGNPANIAAYGNPLSYYYFILSAIFRKDGQRFTIGTTHFPVTPDGKTDDVQRSSIQELLKQLESFPEIVLCGDFNAPRGGEIFAELAKRYKDNIPPHYTTSIDVNLHRAGEKLHGRQLMIDGLFTTPGYQCSNVRLQDGVSDHLAILAEIRL